SAKLGKEYESDLFVGDVHNGTLYHFDLNKTRTGLSLQGPLRDGVANNTEELEGVIFASGFGGITDIEVGSDGYLYVLSYVHRSIYRIIPAVADN
ncbi:MAG TPA: quinoprotein glucose dehydrogenase, partial [Nitrososphaeraceae archaeon]|nr:quinoprotein glucose dehydrogenase [Nitrososphaeraceae archaeon]